MQAFPKYEKYKESGVEWLGPVPDHWDVSCIRAVTQLKSEKNQPDLQVLSVYREFGVITKDSREDNHNATSLDTSNYKVVRPGDTDHAARRRLPRRIVDLAVQLGR